MVAPPLPARGAGRRPVTVIEPMIGGGGGRPSRDGVDGCDASLGFLKTTPAETLEAEVPIVVRRFHLIQDSAGPGRFRGGFGVRLDFQVFQPEGLVTARGMERLRFAPWGVAGGTAGATGSVMLNPGRRAAVVTAIASPVRRPMSWLMSCRAWSRAIARARAMASSSTATGSTRRPLRRSAARAAPTGPRAGPGMLCLIS